MSFADFAAFVERALFLDRDDPVAAWGGLRAFQAELIDRLRQARELRIEAEGTDLTLSVKGRTWVNSDGRRNMPQRRGLHRPARDVGQRPHPLRHPVAPPPASTSPGVELEFRDGEVVAARADAGRRAPPARARHRRRRRRLGELGIGTNFGIDRPVGTILFDEKIGGTVHLALGRSYPETGGKNESALHWDLICDLRRGGRLTADGEPIQIDGTPRLGGELQRVATKCRYATRNSPRTSGSRRLRTAQYGVVSRSQLAETSASARAASPVPRVRPDGFTAFIAGCSPSVIAS